MLLSLYTGRQNGWMAVLGALDVGLDAAPGRLAPGPRRGCWPAWSPTAAIVLASNWFITAAQLGAMLGLAAVGVGDCAWASHHAWILVAAGQWRRSTWRWIVVGLVVAAVAVALTWRLSAASNSSRQVANSSTASLISATDSAQ